MRAVGQRENSPRTTATSERLHGRKITGKPYSVEGCGGKKADGKCTCENGFTVFSRLLTKRTVPADS